jgi:hypothetical protein
MPNEFREECVHYLMALLLCCGFGAASCSKHTPMEQGLYTRNCGPALCSKRMVQTRTGRNGHLTAWQAPCCTVLQSLLGGSPLRGLTQTPGAHPCPRQ